MRERRDITRAFRAASEARGAVGRVERAAASAAEAAPRYRFSRLAADGGLVKARVSARPSAAGSQPDNPLVIVNSLPPAGSRVRICTQDDSKEQRFSCPEKQSDRTR